MHVTRNRWEGGREFGDQALRVDDCPGVAFFVLGYETEPTDNSEWDGVEERTGLLVVRMVGDKRHWAVDPDEVRNLAREDYCGECGQVGCAHDGLDRSEADKCDCAACLGEADHDSCAASGCLCAEQGCR